MLAVVGGGVWAATSFLQTGAQPAEALPADTLAYVAVDLDPSGGQKLEALRTLRKFPALDDAGLGTDTDTDLTRALFDLVQESGAGCAGLDYDADLADWLGERAAVGLLPGGDEPDVVGVVQVADESAASDGLAALAACATTSDADDPGDGGGFGYVVDGEWAVLAEDEETAQDVVDSSAEGALAADDSFERWTDAAGDPGVLAAYAAPGLADELTPEGVTGGAGGLLGGLEDFEGAALTVRFATRASRSRPPATRAGVRTACWPPRTSPRCSTGCPPTRPPCSRSGSPTGGPSRC
ncbi:hypothetical protein GCM10009737_11630 [Nocardioides lentus]|uniref:DUF3352 domain-containing protein n=1 Tax=Nocardioides lentus TaxID=338077 RepID=A0ABP5AEK4_9ACTN